MPRQHRLCRRPGLVQQLGKTGLLQFEDKNGDGRIQYYNDKNAEMAKKAEAWGWKGNEMVKVDNDIMVLANPEIAGLPNWVIAIVVAGGLAAALSTAAGLLMAIASAVSHDRQGHDQPEHLGEIGAAGEPHVDGRRHRAGRLLLGLHPPGFAAGTVVSRSVWQRRSSRRC